MKFLLVHNYYRSQFPSGESEVVRLERQMLLDNGHAVETFTRDSDELIERPLLGTVKAALTAPWNPAAAKSIKDKVASFAPDVVHVHNTFPLLSPSIFRSIGRNALRVLTLHNYRIVCPAAIPMRDQRICTECIEKRSAIPSLYHGCYRNSRAATLPLAMTVGLHRAIGTWRNEVDAFICLSKFQRDLMVEGGLPPEKLYVKPNFYPTVPSPLPWEDRENYVVFAGRLSPEKGVVNLLETWRKWGVDAPRLICVGDGPLRQRLEEMAGGMDVTFTGQVPPDLAADYISKARLMVVPSEWFEGFPMVVREAFAFGTPLMVSDMGPLPSFVRNGRAGLVFKAGDSRSLLSALRSAWSDTGLLRKLGTESHYEFQSHYTQQANYRLLMDIYNDALSRGYGHEFNSQH